MQQLIDDMLAFAWVGTPDEPAAPVDCGALVDRVIAQLDGAIRESDALVSTKDLPVVLGHASQLEQVFQNLIANAIKFHGPAQPRVTITVQPRGAEWLFAVQDNGIGIAPAYAERVFVLFQRLHTRDEYPGTGIGLAICKKIVERHGGTITLKPAPVQGTCVLFTLPAAPAG
jgi:light-regulated signal transduction histidine kinase (bacteriophytochrome)